MILKILYLNTYSYFESLFIIPEHIYEATLLMSGLEGSMMDFHGTDVNIKLYGLNRVVLSEL
jgi:hypothetical protein